MAANEWPEKTRMMVTIGIGVAANIALATLFYFAYTDWKEKDTTLQKRRAEIATLKAVVDEKPKKDAALKTLQVDFETKKEKLPDAAAIERLLDDVAPIAQHNGCIRKSFHPGVPEAGGSSQNLAKTAFGTHWQADFFGWMKMINEIEERFPRFVGFENLRMTPPNNGVVATGAIHEVDVDIITYMYVRTP